jgi:DNA-nicking Smr family endonuclease
MRKKQTLSDEERQLFNTQTADIIRLQRDTVFLKPDRASQKQLVAERRYNNQQNELHYFSDTFQPLLAEEGPVRYLRAGADSFELKKLRRSLYLPDVFLDLHGLSQQQAKIELAALINLCLDQRLPCACVMHGHGKNILKRQTPLWLAQHPAIIAFHQAPKEHGGNAAILLLIEVPE